MSTNAMSTELLGQVTEICRDAGISKSQYLLSEDGAGIVRLSFIAKYRICLPAKTLLLFSRHPAFYAVRTSATESLSLVLVFRRPPHDPRETDPHMND